MQLSVGFYTQGLAFSGDTLKTKSLGGSETAMICMARELAALDCSVKVFCNLDGQPGVYDDVEYLPQEAFPEIIQSV